MWTARGKPDTARPWTIIIAACSLIVGAITGAATIYYNFAWRPPNLRMFVNPPLTEAINGPDLTLHLTFINAGVEVAAVDEISLIQVTGQSSQFSDASELSAFALFADTLIPSAGFAMRLDNGRLAKLFRPSKVLVDNAVSSTASLFMTKESIHSITASFKVEYVYPDGLLLTAHFLQLRYFDGQGRVHNRVIPLWRTTGPSGVPQKMNTDYHWTTVYGTPLLPDEEDQRAASSAPQPLEPEPAPVPPVSTDPPGSAPKS